METQSVIDTHTVTVPLTRPVYQTICYFDIFNYPLKSEEIQKFCTEKIDGGELLSALSELIEKNKISRSGGYYFLSGSNLQNITDRIDNEVRLAAKLSTIKKYAGLINKFPFVEATFISGSVSKGVLDKGGDVDYFIIAKPGRVWLCRTLLIAFKKIVLLNSRKYFCVNYFIDTQSLKVPDSNLFVATEIKTLLPVTANAMVKKFVRSNDWINRFFPNHTISNQPLIHKEGKKFLFSKMIESLCASSFGERMDNYFFKKTLNRWQKKFPHFKKEEFDLNMRSYKSVSKHHPQGNQNRVLTALAERMSKFE